MDLLIQQLVSGVAVASTYALVALGFVLIFGVANVLNVAQAQTIMLAPMFVMIGMAAWHLPAVVAVIVSIAVTLAIGVLIHVCGVQPFLSRQRKGGTTEPLAPLIATFGLSILVENIFASIYGTISLKFPLSISRTVWRLGSAAITPMQVISIGASLVLMIGLGLLVMKTNLGRAMRVVAESPLTAETLGISSRFIVISVSVIAAALGAIAGLLFASGTSSVSAFMGLQFGLIGLIVMIVGGVNSIPGAVLAALLIGVVQELAAGFFSTSYNDVWTFGVLIIVLIFRPQGLLVGRSKEARP